MKKFDIKKLLILVLAFVMVFALVACNKESGNGGGEDPDPTPTPTPTKDTGKYIQPAAYFDALWKASAVLGSQTFKEADSAALSADLNVKLAIGDDVLDLGIAIGAVLDTKGTFTAAKVKLYDHDKNANWFTIFYFAEDQDNLYVEAYDQKLCIPVAVSEVIPDVGKEVKGLLDKTVIGANPEKGIEGQTLTALINKIKTAGGADWTIDELVDVILGLLGMSLDDVIELVNGLNIVTLDEGSKSLLPVLEQLGGILFNKPEKKKGNWTGECTKEEIDGGYCYTGNVGGSLGLVGMLSGLVKDYVGDLINEDSSLQLIFNTVEDKDGIKDIDGFKIKVQSYGVDVAGGKDVTVEIGINEVKIENLGAVKKGDAADFFGFVKNDFKTNFNINLTVDLDITNKAIAIAYDDLAVDFTGAYKLELNGIIDLVEGTNTEADLALTFNDAPIISAYFGSADGETSQLVVKVDNKVTISGYSVVETLAKLFAPYGLEALAKSDDAMFQKAAVDLSNAAFGTEFATAADVLNAVAAWKEDTTTSAFTTYNTEFQGAAIMNLDLVQMIVDLINGLISGGEGPAVSSAEPTLSIPCLIATVFDAISFENGISVKVDSILAKIQAIFGSGEFDNSNNYVITPFAEADALAMLGITDTGLTGWWQTFFAGSSWIKEAGEVASLTNLLKSGAEVSISIGDVAKINAKVTTPDNATVTATIALKGEVESDYEYETIETDGLVLLNVIEE